MPLLVSLSLLVIILLLSIIGGVIWLYKQNRFQSAKSEAKIEKLAQQLQTTLKELQVLENKANLVSESTSAREQEIKDALASIGSNQLVISQQVSENDQSKILPQILTAIDEMEKKHEAWAIEQSQKILKIDSALEPIKQAFTPRRFNARWIAIPFEKALSLTPLLNEAKESSHLQIANRVSQFLPDVGTIAISGVSSVQSNGQIVVAFSEASQKLLAAKELVIDKSGLPLLRDANGRTFEWAKRVGDPSTLLAATSAVVSASHIIAGVDNARQLKAIRQDVSYLLKARQNDQISQLEADYVYCQKLLDEPLDHTKILELRRVIRDLHKLRGQLRRDLIAKLEQIEDPSYFEQFCRWGGVTSFSDNRIESNILGGQDILALLRFIFLFQLALEQSLETLDTFVKFDAKSEAYQLEQVNNVFQEKRKKLTKDSQNENVRQMIADFDETLNFFQNFREEGLIKEHPHRNRSCDQQFASAGLCPNPGLAAGTR